MANLPAEISRLSVADKFELLDAIWEDLATHAPAELSEEQSAELDRRVARYERNPSSVVPWEAIKTDLLKQ